MALKIDWCNAAAAKYACTHWHYSKSLPPPPHVCVGAWEDDVFIGVVLFARGASPNLLMPFGLTQIEGCELVRVALTAHKAPVTQIVAIALKFLKKSNPKLRLVVSYADPKQGHHGGIYQGGGWIYTGKNKGSVEYLAPDGKIWHSRMIKKSGETKIFGKKRSVWKTDQCVAIKCEGKHRYIMPLDKIMRDKVNSMSKPYPKRVGSACNGTSSPLEGGGVIPTPTLQINQELNG